MLNRHRFQDLGLFTSEQEISRMRLLLASDLQESLAI